MAEAPVFACGGRQVGLRRAGVAGAVQVLGVKHGLGMPGVCCITEPCRGFAVQLAPHALQGRCVYGLLDQRVREQKAPAIKADEVGRQQCVAHHARPANDGAQALERKALADHGSRLERAALGLGEPVHAFEHQALDRRRHADDFALRSQQLFEEQRVAFSARDAFRNEAAAPLDQAASELPCLLDPQRRQVDR